MSVLYRSIWSDDRNELVAAAIASFRDWVASKSNGGLVLPDAGQVNGTTSVRTRRPGGEWDVSAQPAEASLWRTDQVLSRSVLEAARATLIERRDDGAHWTTTLRTWSCTEPENADLEEGAGWLWVDVEVVTSESLEGTVIAPPRLVRDLIANGRSPRRRCVALHDSARRYEGEDGAEVLAALLSHRDRDLPVVVFSDDPVRTRPPRLSRVPWNFGGGPVIIRLR